jgi:hypothetical protein
MFPTATWTRFHVSATCALRRSWSRNRHAFTRTRRRCVFDLTLSYGGETMFWVLSRGHSAAALETMHLHKWMTDCEPLSRGQSATGLRQDFRFGWLRLGLPFTRKSCRVFATGEADEYLRERRPTFTLTRRSRVRDKLDREAIQAVDSAFPGHLCLRRPRHLVKLRHLE